MPIIWNTTEDEHLEEILRLLKGATRFECAVAFAKMSGFNKFKKVLLSSIKNGMSARIIIGLNFFITDPEVLEEIYAWKNSNKKSGYGAIRTK